jgi:DNA invertase Pin-like site-specific DNA recombinase
MRRSASIALLLVLALLALAVPSGTAQDQGGSQPRELWEEFPLDSDRSSPPPRDGQGSQAEEGAGASQPPTLGESERVAEPAADDGLPLWLLPLLGLLAFVGGVFAAKAVLGLMKRRRESGRRRAPPARREPAPGQAQPQAAVAERPPAEISEPTRADQPAPSDAEPAPTKVSAPKPQLPKEAGEIERPAPPKDKRREPKVEEPVAAAPPGRVEPADTEPPKPKAPEPTPSKPRVPKPRVPKPTAPKPEAPRPVEAERASPVETEHPATERPMKPVPVEAKRPEPQVEEPTPEAPAPRRAEPADTAPPKPQAPEPKAPEPQAPEPQAPEPQAPEPRAPEPETPSPAKAKRPARDSGPARPEQPAGPEEGLPEDVIPFPTARPARPGRRSTRTAQRALGYVSAADAEGQAGDLAAQTEQIRAACVRNGFESVEVVRDFESHSGSDLERPGLVYAIEKLEAGDATCLVVASLERLTRSAAHLGTLIDRLSAGGIRLVVLDIQLDTGNPDGRLAAEALASVGTLERRNLDARTRKGLQAARKGRRSGRPAVADRPALKERIAEMRARGMTLQAIADTLNTEGVPTLRGGTEWRPSSVQAAVGYKRPKRGAGKTDNDTVDSDSGGGNNGGSAEPVPRGGS